MESNPLHPFELHPYGSLSLFGLDISPNKAVVMMWIVIVLASSLLIIAARQQRLVPTRLQSLAEILVEFIQLARRLPLAVRLLASLMQGQRILAVLFGMVVLFPLISVPLQSKSDS